MKFDLTVGNPPYTKGLDIDIHKSFSKISKRIVFVHPSTFLISHKRKLYNKFRDMGVVKEKLDCWIEKVWLQKQHWFTEFQFSNVAKLVYIFGPQINVYAGDSLNMKYAKDEDKGLLFFNEKRKSWLNIPNLQPEVERKKDNLPDLITFFTVLESAWNRINAMKN